MEPTRTDETRQPDSAERSRRRAAQEIADGYAAALKRLEPALAEVLAVNQELETLDSRVRGESERTPESLASDAFGGERDCGPRGWGICLSTSIDRRRGDARCARRGSWRTRRVVPARRVECQALRRFYGAAVSPAEISVGG